MPDNAFDKVKKQINSQTREKVGVMKIESEGTTFVETPVPGSVGTDPTITWDKTWYSRNRGTYFALDVFSFNDPIASKSNQQIFTNVGNFSDRASVPYYNARYSGWAGIDGGGTITFRIIAQGSLTVYIDQELVHSSGESAATPVDITLLISDRSYIQIFWYAEAEESTFDLSGNISRYLTLWQQSDSSPFQIPVEWYNLDEGPVSITMSTNNGTPTASVTLRWWFGDPGYNEETVNIRTNYSDDLGGFGIWNINFQEIGEIDVISDTEIIVPGYYPNARYLRIGETIYKPQYVSSADLANNSTTFVFEAHGLTDDNDGDVIEVGALVLVRNMPISEFGGYRDVYETTDNEITWGETYYYLIDTYDTSPNMNRGGLTETPQVVIAGDIVAPPYPSNFTGTRNAVDSVNLSWDQDVVADVEKWYVYSDAGSETMTVIEGEDTYIVVSNITPAVTHMENLYGVGNTGNILITIEDADGNKIVREVFSVGSILELTEALPAPLAANDTVRFLSVWSSLPADPVIVTPVPRPPREVNSAQNIAPDDLQIVN
jgi:hypothetical protein